MNRSSEGPEEPDGIVERLLAHRAELTPLELDRIKTESRARAIGRPRTHGTREERSVMKTRTGLLAVLASGALLSSGGVAMGVSGLAAAGNSAATAQYNATTPTQTTSGAQGQVQGASGQVQGATGQVLGATNTKSPSNAVSGATQSTPAAVAQPTRQEALSNGGNQLPFTGYAAIPVLLLGLGLLGTGVVMRRRSRASDR
jgi:cobalamin biosynthesis Mg chelatase CobN